MRASDSPVPAAAIWVLGFGQLVNWGVLYYAFAVLLVPLERALAAPRSAVAGAFSLGLLVSAALAPAAGRLADRGRGPVLMRVGGITAALALVAWASVPSLVTTYAAWTVLGASMAATLYEPVFVVVGRAFSDADARLRAIATVTVLGGLASTVFLPMTSLLVDRWGWRSAVAVLAAVVAVSTIVVDRIAFTGQAWASPPRDGARSLPPAATLPPATRVTRLIAVFALSSIVNSALASNLVAALIDRELTPMTAATIAGLFGILQLPGRVLMTNATFVPGPLRLLLASFALQAAGLVVLMASPSMSFVLTGVMLFAAGAGLTTVARPYLVLHAFGATRAGFANGAIARAQQVARASGPVAAATMASATGYGSVFMVLTLLLAAASVLAANVDLGRSAPTPTA